VHLAGAVATAVREVERELGQRIKAYMSFERSAAIAIDVIYDLVRDHVLLARCFAIIPFSALPEREHEFAVRVAGAPVAADAQVLTLIASRGSQPEWNARRRSKRHLAVPLDVAARSSPMIASLLGDIDTDSARDGGARTFYVFDASTTTDQEGRLKIPDRDFVRDHDVRTVFGVGAVLPEVTYVMIFFARHHVTRSIADQFVPIGQTFATMTVRARAEAHFFDAD
jgi:hypothetical protein